MGSFAEMYSEIQRALGATPARPRAASGNSGAGGFSLARAERQWRGGRQTTRRGSRSSGCRSATRRAGDAGPQGRDVGIAAGERVALVGPSGAANRPSRRCSCASTTPTAAASCWTGRDARDLPLGDCAGRWRWCRRTLFFLAAASPRTSPTATRRGRRRNYRRGPEGQRPRLYRQFS